MQIIDEYLVENGTENGTVKQTNAVELQTNAMHNLKPANHNNFHLIKCW